MGGDFLKTVGLGLANGNADYYICSVGNELAAPIIGELFGESPTLGMIARYGVAGLCGAASLYVVSEVAYMMSGQGWFPFFGQYANQS